MLIGYRYRVEIDDEDTELNFAARLESRKDDSLYFDNGVELGASYLHWSTSFEPLDPLPEEHIQAVREKHRQHELEMERIRQERRVEYALSRPELAGSLGVQLPKGAPIKGPDPAVWGEEHAKAKH